MHMKDYITGIILIIIVTMIIWGVQLWLFPKPLSILETWGFVAAFLLVKGAADTYKQEKNLSKTQ